MRISNFQLCPCRSPVAAPRCHVGMPRVQDLLEVSMKTHLFGIVLFFVLALTSACPAQDDVAILLRRVPEAADAILIVRLNALLDSPRGQQENWNSKYQLGYLNGAVRIPPSVRSLLLASEIHTDPSTPCTTFGVALLNSRKRVSMSGLAIRSTLNTLNSIARLSLRARGSVLTFLLRIGDSLSRTASLTTRTRSKWR